LKRYDAIKVITESLKEEELIIASTGMISRELSAIKDSPRNFYMLGSMGLASSIGLGLVLCLPAKRVVVIEGDGSALMNMGSMATIGHFAPQNLTHIVLDNEAHDSTGGQPTVSNTVKLEEVAGAAGYANFKKVYSVGALNRMVNKASKIEGSHFILVKVEKGGPEGIGRVSLSPEEIKERFRAVIASTGKVLKHD